jgi:hypothetical protein
VFLIAYTDLPIGRTSSAPIWNEETIMDWPEAANASSLQSATVPELAVSGYRLGIYEYQYVRDGAEARGRFLTAQAMAAGRAASLSDPPLSAD